MQTQFACTFRMSGQINIYKNMKLRSEKYTFCGSMFSKPKIFSFKLTFTANTFYLRHYIRNVAIRNPDCIISKTKVSNEKNNMY